jgi:hypothetical protein
MDLTLTTRVEQFQAIIVRLLHAACAYDGVFATGASSRGTARPTARNCPLMSASSPALSETAAYTLYAGCPRFRVRP